MWRFLSFFIALIPLSASGFDEKVALTESQAAIGRQIAASYRFIDSNAQVVRLGELRGKPLVVSFVYTGCVQTCPASTQFLAAAVREAERALGAGTFRVATIGFNLPFDDPASMRSFARKFGIASPGWLFLTPEADALAALTSDFGFRYEATAAGFDHLLQVTILDGEGRVYRQVYGDAFETPVFTGALLELAQDAPVAQPSLGAMLEKVRLLCTVYDPAAGRYRLNYVVIIELLIGASVMLGGCGFLIVEWRRRRLTHIKSEAEPAS